MSKVLRSLAIQDDGKLVAAGNLNGRFYLTRFNNNGAIDSAFGTDGMVITGGTADAMAVTIQSDGKILATGSSYGMTSCTARYGYDGSLDTSFANNGLYLTSFKGYNVSKDINQSHDSNILRRIQVRSATRDND